MSIISKTQDDGLQILEQILPASTLRSTFLSKSSKRPRKNVTSPSFWTCKLHRRHEADFSQRRTLVWTLNFTIKTYLFGPVDVQKDIRKAVVDYRSDVKTRKLNSVTRLRSSLPRLLRFQDKSTLRLTLTR